MKKAVSIVEPKEKEFRMAEINMDREEIRNMARREGLERELVHASSQQTTNRNTASQLSGIVRSTGSSQTSQNKSIRYALYHCHQLRSPQVQPY